MNTFFLLNHKLGRNKGEERSYLEQYVENEDLEIYKKWKIMSISCDQTSIEESIWFLFF